MRPKTLLALFSLVAVLGAFIWFIERDLPGSDERALREKLVLGFEADEIVEISVERDTHRVRLTRPAAANDESVVSDDESVVSDNESVAPDDGSRAKREWQLEEPFGVRADREAADQLAVQLSGLQRERILEDPDPSAVGLEEPRAVVTVRTPTEERSFAVGADVPASPNMIIGRTGQAWVVPKAILTPLLKTAGDWRSRDVFPLHRGAVERIEMAGENGGLNLGRRDEGFAIESPLQDLAGKELIEEFLDSLFRFEVESFIDEPREAETLGLDPVRSRLAVTFIGLDAPVIVEFGTHVSEGDTQSYARLGEQVVTVGDGLDEALSRSAADWQETSWTAFEVFEVDSFRVVEAAGELLVERSGSDWARNGVEIAHGPVSDLLYAVVGAAGLAVVDRSALGSSVPKPRLELTLKGSQREETLTLYAGRPLAGRSGRDFLVELSEGAVEDLQLKLEAVREEPAKADEEEVGEAEG